MQGLDTLKSVGGTSGGSLSEQIPQAVSQAITPLIQSTAKDINAELVGNGGAALVGSNFGPNPLPQPIGLPFRPGGFESLLRNHANVDFTGSFSRVEPALGPAQMLAKGGKTEAAAVQSQGRGDDTMLVHMTPGEVSGLQALAEQHGGSLTINPQTGLPEAGFLKSLLPTLIGAGLTMIPGVGPLMAAGIVGGGTALATGDIGKGLMAGLGAYGGGNIGQALTGAGREVALQAAQPEILQNTFTGNLGAAGSGLANVFSTDAAGTVARDAFIGQAADSAAGTAATGLGGGLGATKTALAATAGPMSQPAPMPEVAQPEYNYDGPYKPTERQVRYPGPDRDPADSSEFQYFDVVNPSPGFEPIGNSTPTTQPIYTYGPDAPRFAGIPVEMATDPERMRDYQANPNLYSFAEGGAAEAAVPPADYVPGKSAEFDYGFRQMAVQTPEIQQEATRYNPVLRERMGTINTNDGGGESTGPNRSTGDMGYIPGIAANVGRSYNSLSDLAKAVIPGAMTVGTIADRSMRDRGYEYNPITGDYEQRDYMGGGDAGYETRSGRDDPSGGYDSYSDAGKAASDRGDAFFRAGGMTMDDGGFVIDAHTVSEIGNGSSDAGHMQLSRLGGEPIKGPGDGTSDSIKANIGGVQEARIAKDENYLSKEDVKRLGGGNLKKGEKMLYKLMAEAHKSRKNKGRGQATGLDKLIARMA